MFFWLKKLIGFWLMPLPFCLLLFGAGLCLLRWPRCARFARGLMVAGTALLLVFSHQTISIWLIRPIENRYPAQPELPAGAPLPAALARCRYVVVLGSGHGNTPGRAALTELSQSALARLTEAVRLLRTLPDARLIVCGPTIKGKPNHAAVLTQAAVSLGIDPTRVIQVEGGRDTEEESILVKQHVGSEPFALVTPAWHMRRSMALFRTIGLDPLPCPCDFTTGDDQKDELLLLWDMDSLERSTWAVRERIGFLWVWLRGKAG